MNPSQPTPPPLVPDYELFRCIGRGGYGEVWLARGITGVWRAVKIVRRDRFVDDRPFLRELEGITRFQKTQFAHGTQLALLHVGRNDAEGTFHYVMELADDAETGSEISPDHYVALTLKEYRVRRSQIPIADCLRIGVDLARALAGLHAQNLVHRDVKPSNIIFVSGTPKLCDIGLVSSSEQTLSSVGTPGYAPPEGPGTASADIYGLGKVLYELATGMNPRDFPMMPPGFINRPDAMALLELNEVVVKACDPAPLNRHASAQVLLDELLMLQAGGSIRELKAARLRIHHLFRLLRWAGAASVVVVAVLGIINGINLRRIADQERATNAKERAAAAQNEIEARRSRYTSALRQASSMIAQGSFAQARAILEQQFASTNRTPGIPGLELEILRGESAERSLRVLKVPGSPFVKHVSFNAAGDRLAAAFGDGKGFVWTLISTNPPTLIPDAFSTWGFLPNGNDLLIGTAEREIRVHSIPTGILSPPEGIRERIQQVLPDRRRALLISRDYPNEFRLLDVETHRLVSSIALKGEWATNEVESLTCSPNGRWLAAGLSVDASARREQRLAVWDMSTGQLVWSRITPGRIECLQFSPDNQELAVANSRTRLWIIQPADGSLRQELRGHSEQILGLAYSPDHQWLASAGADSAIHLWNRTNLSAPQVLFSHGSPIKALQFNDTSTLLASGAQDGEIRLWSIPSAPPASVISGLWEQLHGAVVLNRDASRIAYTDVAGSVRVRSTLPGTAETVLTNAFQPLGFSRDQSLLHTLGADCSIQTWAAPNWNLVSSRPGPAITPVITAIEASPDGERFALGRRDETLEIWDVAAARQTGGGNAHSNIVFALGWNADSSSLASGGSDRRIFIWNPTNSTPRQVISVGTADITSLGWSLSGDELAAGLEDGETWVWNVSTTNRIAILQAHSALVQSVVFSPDGTRLVTGGKDGDLVVWDRPTYRAWLRLPTELLGMESPTSTIRGGRGIAQLRFGTSPSILSAYLNNGTAHWWRLAPP